MCLLCARRLQHSVYRRAPVHPVPIRKSMQGHSEAIVLKIFSPNNKALAVRT